MGKRYQIFSVRMLFDKNTTKMKKVYTAFIDLEKVFDRIEWKAMWDVLTQ